MPNISIPISRNGELFSDHANMPVTQGLDDASTTAACGIGTCVGVEGGLGSFVNSALMILLFSVLVSEIWFSFRS